jgi:hypothetical protein
MAAAACGSSDDAGRSAEIDAGIPGSGGASPGTGGSVPGAGATGLTTGGPTSGTPGSVTPATMGMALDPTDEQFIRDATGGSGVDPATVTKLKAGGPSCVVAPAYPYDGTVFPGGLIAPPIMWQGGADAAYVRMRYQSQDILNYEFAVGPTNPGELRVPAADWAEITRRTQGTPLEVTFSVKQGGAISTCTQKWTIAGGNMVGALYYNTYNEPTTGGSGAVMRLTMGGPKSDLYLSYQGGAVAGVPGIGGLVGAIPGAGNSTPCTSCHSVSASGNTIAASTHDYVASRFDVGAYALGDTPQPMQRARLDGSAFGGLSPNGELMLKMGNPDCTGGADSFPRAKNNFPMVEGTSAAHLINTVTGAVVPSTGLKAENYMWMPQFSADGRKVVFNHARPDGSGGTNRRDLAVVDFDPATNTFSEPRIIASGQGPAPSLPYQPGSAGGVAIPAGVGCQGPGGGGFGIPIPGTGDVGALPNGSCTGPCYPAWPFFTPDGRGVIYALTNEPDFMSAFPGRDKPALSELWYVDLQTQEKVRLDKANKGLKDADALANYYPTVLPIQVGGYYWAFWTSRREFGHRDLSGGPNAVFAVSSGPSAREAFHKRIWVTAIQPPGAGEFASGTLMDPSYPPFYLEGQGDTGNVRAFAALNPCKQLGATCVTGVDCCTGFCTLNKASGQRTCSPERACAELNERCTTDANCCHVEGQEMQNHCIGGYCGFLLR